jgi:F0F1-type ATP synthase membrane subunit b/b'
MLEINIPTIVFEIINFIALSVLLYFLLLKPGIKKVQARTEAKRKAEQEIQHNLVVSEQSRLEWETKLANIEEKIGQLVEKNRKQLEIERQDILHGVKEEARDILQTARHESVESQKLVSAEFQDKVLDAIVEISAHVIARTAPEELQGILVEQMNERIWQLGRDEMNRVDMVRRSLDKRQPTAFVKSPLPLTPEQNSALLRTLSALADTEIHLETSVEPELAAGLYVRIGDIVLDNSISSQLQEYRQEIRSMLEDGITHE